MKDLIKRNIDGKKILLLLISTNIVYAFMLMLTIPKVMGFAGRMKLLDMMPTGYSIDYVNVLLNALGEQGRNVYLFWQLPLDALYPVLFATSYCLALAYMLNKLGKLEGSLFYFCLLPLFAGLFDYCENIGIIIMLNAYPNNSNTLIHITSVFSILKSFFTTTYFIILIISLIAFVGIRVLPIGKQNK